MYSKEIFRETVIVSEILVSVTNLGYKNHNSKDMPLDKLQAKFKEAFGSEDLQLDKRVVYVHGIPDSLALPDTVAGEVMCYGANTTLPIAAGKIDAAQD